MSARTLFEKIWDAHVVAAPKGQSALLYIDLHLVHEVTSPQAFEGLRANRPTAATAVADGCDGRPQHPDDATRLANLRPDRGEAN